MLPGALTTSPAPVVSGSATIAGITREIRSMSVSREMSWLDLAGRSEAYKSADGSVELMPDAVVTDGLPTTPWDKAPDIVPGHAVDLSVTVAPAAPSPADPAWSGRVLAGLVETGQDSMASTRRVPVVDDWQLLSARLALDPSDVSGHPLATVAMIARSIGIASHPTGSSLNVFDAPLQGSAELPYWSNGVLDYGSTCTPALMEGIGPAVTAANVWYQLTSGSMPVVADGKAGWSLQAIVDRGDGGAEIEIQAGSTTTVLSVDSSGVTVSGGGTAHTYRALSAGQHQLALVTLPIGGGQARQLLRIDGATKAVIDRQIAASSAPAPPSTANPWAVAITSMGTAALAAVRIESHRTADPPAGWGPLAPTMIWRLTSADMTAAAVVPARPALDGPINELLATCAARLGAGIWMDEEGRLVWMSWRAANDFGLEVREIEAVSDAEDLAWRQDLAQRPSRVGVRRRSPSLRPYPATAWVAEDTQISPGVTSRQVFGPGQDTDWVGVDTSIDPGVGWSTFRSCFQWQHTGSSTGSKGLAYRCARVDDQQKWTWEVTNIAGNPSPATLRFTTGPYVGAPGPIIRARCVISWAEVITYSSPSPGAEQVHDGDWMLSAAEAAAVQAELVRQMNTPRWDLINLQLWPDPRLQLGDLVAVNIRRPTGGKTVWGVITASRLEVAPGSMTQTIDLRTVRVADIP